MKSVTLWKAIIIPLIFFLHVLPFYLLVVRHEVVMKEEVVVAVETDIEFEDDIYDQAEKEVVEREDPPCNKDEKDTAYVAYRENDSTRQPFRGDRPVQGILPASNNIIEETDVLPERQEKERENVAKKPQPIPDYRKDDIQEKATERYGVVKKDSGRVASEVPVANEYEKDLFPDSEESVVNYQEYYDSYNYYAPPEGEDGYKPSLALVVRKPEFHTRILREMGFQLTLRPRKTTDRALNPEIDNFHIVVKEDSEMVLKNGLPVGFALNALEKDRLYYLKKVSTYPWFADISTIPLEVVFIPKLPECRNYVLGRMYKAMQDLGLKQKDVIEITGEIKNTREGRLVLIITELIVRKEGGYGFQKIPYNDYDLSRFNFIS